MKAMIWKELKENLKWAVLATLGLALIYAYMLSQVFSQYESYRPYGNEYQSQGLPLPTAITAPIIGILLGFLQIFPELRRDQWAFLLHRPVPRATLFWGKAFAGLLLFLPATLLPFLGAVIWLATPGRMAAPFDWRLALPGIADTLTGIVFYFAGILTALRPARWYGSRALGIAAAVICFFVSQSMYEFWQALLVIAAGAAVVLIAARGSFLTSGSYNGQPKLAKAALGATLYAGGALACCATVGFLLSVVSAFTYQRTPYAYNRYEVDRAGRILLVSYEESVIKSRTDLNGRSVAKVEESKSEGRGEFLSQMSLPISRGPDYVPSYRSPSRYYISLSNSPGSDGGDNWYYSRQRGLILAYSIRNKRLNGYLTPDGFVAANDTSTPIRPFKGPPRDSGYSYQSSHLLVFSENVYWFNRMEKRITAVASSPPAEPFKGAMEFVSSSPTADETRYTVLAVAGKELRGYSQAGKPLFTMPLRPVKNDFSSLDVALMPEQNRLFLINTIYNRPGENPPSSYATEITLIKDSLKPALRDYTLPPLDRTTPKPQREDLRQALSGLLIPPGMAASFTGYAALGHLIGKSGTGSAPATIVNGVSVGDDNVSVEVDSNAERMWKDINRDWTLYGLLIALSVLSGLVAAGLGVLVGRRCAFSKKEQWAWAMGIFVLGPFGVLMLLGLYEWPARVACPSCGKPRVVSRERCEHCGAGFTAPARDGTEIFEPVG